jgi:hypothetical protein
MACICTRLPLLIKPRQNQQSCSDVRVSVDNTASCTSAQLQLLLSEHLCTCVHMCTPQVKQAGDYVRQGNASIEVSIRYF